MDAVVSIAWLTNHIGNPDNIRTCTPSWGEWGGSANLPVEATR